MSLSEKNEPFTVTFSQDAINSLIDSETIIAGVSETAKITRLRLLEAYSENLDIESILVVLEASLDKAYQNIFNISSMVLAQRRDHV